MNFYLLKQLYVFLLIFPLNIVLNLFELLLTYFQYLSKNYKKLLRII